MNGVSTPKQSLWEHLGNHPGEAHRMELRSQLMRELTRIIKSWNLSQPEAALKMGVDKTRVNQLLKGHIEKFSLDALITMLHKAGVKTVVSFETVESTQ